MDANLLDSLARMLGTPGSRRRVLAGLFAGALTMREAVPARAKKKPRCPTCRRCGSKCCPSGRRCVGKACVAPCVGAACGSFKAACPNVLPANNVWNTEISSLPVDEKSNAYVASIGGATGLHPDFGAGNFGGGPIGIPVITISGNTPPANVTFQYPNESDRGPYPIPSRAPIEGGTCADGDRHILIVDTRTCTLYELFDARPLAKGRWKAGSGAIYDLNSNELRRAGWTSADAAGLPILPGLVRYEEVASGEIKHALRFTVPRTRADYVWPARHEASSDNNPNLPPLGQRFRLKAGVDLTGFSATNQVILTALKRYGMFLADNGSAWYLSGAPDPRWNNDDLHELQERIQGSDFEAIDEADLQVSPDSGQAS